MYIYIYTELEIGGIASPNANHFWGKAIRQILLALRITFGRLQITFQMVSPKDFLFWSSSLCR